jgi:hypothetical protein
VSFRRRRTRPRTLAIAVAACLLASPGNGRGNDDLDDALEGFDSPAPAGVEEALDGFDDGDADGVDEDLAGADGGEESPSEYRSERFWEFTGSVSVGTSVNYLEHSAVSGVGKKTDWQGVSRLRTRLNLELDMDLPFEWKSRVSGFGYYDFAYLINGRSNFTREVKDEYEWEVDFNEVWVQGELLDDVDLKVGRQVVNWGRSDNLRVTDILNPVDIREPGLVDIEDLRRTVTMVKADYFWDRWAFSAIAIPEIRFNLSPVFGNDFFSATSSLGTVGFALLREEIPSISLANTEWALSATGIYSGWDMSLYFARHWRDQAYLHPNFAVIPGPGPGDPPSASFAGSELRHSRLWMVGAGANYTVGSWLFKSEIAWQDGIDYAISTPVDLTPFGGQGIVDIPVDTVEKSRLDFMAGVEYYGITDTNISIEVANRHIFGFREDMRPLFGLQENSLETSIRLSRTFLRERLELACVAVIFGLYAQDGSIVRLEGRYDVIDALELSGGIVFYQKGDPVPFDTIKRNDRVFFEVKYSF